MNNEITDFVDPGNGLDQFYLGRVENPKNRITARLEVGTGCEEDLARLVDRAATKGVIQLNTLLELLRKS